MWASKLLFVEFGINTTMNVSIGKSPHEIIFGVQPWIPVNVMLAAN